MPRAAPLPDGLPPAFSVPAAMEAGLTRSRLRASDLEAPFRGARIVRGAVAPTDRFHQEQIELMVRCAAFVPVAPPGYRFSHATAARIHGMPLPGRLVLDPAIDVAVGPAEQPPRGRGVRGHRIPITDIQWREGLPVVAPELAWLQVSPLLTLDELVIAGDFLVRRKLPLSSRNALSAVVANHSGARGIVVARAALGDIRSGTDSPRESATRLVILRSGLPEPVIGHQVHDADGFFVGTPDLAYVRERIAIEYEGEVHWRDARVFQDDIERRELFERAGWRVFRVTNDHILYPHRLVSRLSELLRERA